MVVSKDYNTRVLGVDILKDQRPDLSLYSQDFYEWLNHNFSLNNPDIKYYMYNYSVQRGYKIWPVYFDDNGNHNFTAIQPTPTEQTAIKVESADFQGLRWA